MMSRSLSAIEQQLICRPPSRGGSIDARTSIGRRRRELIKTFVAALGGVAAVSEGQVIDIRKAAELTALAEQSRARVLREGAGGAGELSVIVRLEGAAARAVRALGIKLGSHTNASQSWTPSRGRLAAQLAASADTAGRSDRRTSEAPAQSGAASG